MSGEHTPGPWWINGKQSIRGPNSEYIAKVNWRGGIDDARLIAAAPDLLAGARLALSEAESWVHDQLDGTSALDGALARLEPVRAAIAKAEGRAP